MVFLVVFLCFCHFRAYSAAQADLELIFLQSQPPAYWNRGGCHCVPVIFVFKSLHQCLISKTFDPQTSKAPEFNSWFCFRIPNPGLQRDKTLQTYLLALT